MSAHPRRRFRAVAVVFLLGAIAIVTAAGRANAQLSYTHTSLLHGLGSDSVIWTTPYPALGSRTSPQYLSSQVQLKDVRAPRLNRGALDQYGLNYAGQRENLGQFVTAAGGQHVLAGHSLGALVARGSYEALGAGASPVAGIVAIAAPHQGALIADSAEHAFQYLRNLETAVKDAARGARIRGAVLTAIGIYLVPGAWWAGALGGAAIAGGMYSIDRGSEVIEFPTAGLEDFPKLKALPDLRRNSPVVGHLKHYYGDGGLPRANIRGSIPHEDALLRLAAAMSRGSSFEELKARKAEGLSSLRGCNNLGNWNFNLLAPASTCRRAIRLLEGLDARWAGWVNGTQYGLVARLPWGMGDIYGQVPRRVPFDGVVPNEWSVYPTTTVLNYDATVPGANHQDIYARTDGLNEVAEGMIAMGMDPATALTASISGPTSYESYETLTWEAVAQGGDGTYTYNWSYRPEGSSQWYAMGSGSSASLDVEASTPSFALRVTVASQGQTVTSATYVTNLAPQPCVPPPGESTCNDY